MRNVIIGLSALLLVSGCGLTTYKQPEEGQPYALVKLKYNYNEVLVNTEIGTRLAIRPGEKKSGLFKKAHDKTYGGVSAGQGPDIPLEAVKLHPGEDLRLKMAVYFYWYTTVTTTQYINGMPQTYTSQQYNERSCKTFMNFTPETGKVYLIDYTQMSVTEQCSAIVYEQVKLGKDKFEMKLVAKSEPPKVKEKEDDSED